MPVSDQGLKYDRYKIVPRTLIFLTRGEKILLIKGAPNKRLWANLYNGIGGHMNNGEDALTAAKRELMEETGLTADDLWLCGTILIDTGMDPGIGIFVFRGIASVKELRNSEEGTLEWVTLESVYELPLVEDLHTLLPIVLRTEKESGPFSALYTYHSDGQIKISIGK